MIIKFSPRLLAERLEVSRSGDVLYVNGDMCDLSQLSEGATIPANAIASKWFVGQVYRVDGELHLTLLLPHGLDAPHSTLFPGPITVSVDGPVELPLYNEEVAQ